MVGNPHRVDRLEFAGSLGDLGTLIPLAVALITITGLHLSSVFGMVGLFYIACGLYYRLPIPVQPLKVVSAIAIAFPDKVTLPVMSATGLLFAMILLALAATGFIDTLARLFTRPIVRGIQLGLGLILIQKGIAFIHAPALFLPPLYSAPSIVGIPLNLLVGLIGVILTLLFLNHKRFPAALILIAMGIGVGISAGALQGVDIRLGPSDLEIVLPAWGDMVTAFWLLVLPQIPLTVGNAIVGTRDTARSLFGTGEVTDRVSHRALCLSMGLANTAVGLLAAMPLCHGAGGLAAHYRFGARTGGSNLMIGLLCLIVAMMFGQVGVVLLASIPNAILGVLLLFAGLELAVLIRDLQERNELFLTLLIAGTALATTHMGIAFAVGIGVSLMMRLRRIQF